MNPNQFRFSAWLFLRLLAAVHAIAFISAWTQIGGLVGPHGILPAGQLLTAVHQQYGAASYQVLPTLCWIFGTGWFLTGMCAFGVLVSVLLFVGISPALCLALLWIDYLSLACAGQIFFDFQWDALLLEATLLAIFFAPWTWKTGWKWIEPPRTARWLLNWLLIRLMLLSGLVKLLSRDPTWWKLTALTYHFETQPLPTPFAWYVSHLPLWAMRDMCAAMFAIELLAPFFLFAPRLWRHVGAIALILLQVAIALTGNYTFFNLLTVSLCVLSLDDAWWGALARFSGLNPEPAEATARHAPNRVLGGVAVFVVFCTGLEAVADFAPGLYNFAPVAALVETVAPFRSLNNYGLFAQMTTTRPELIFSGSDNGRDWEPYEFPHKPGELSRRPDFVAPAQPRLDWQLWFAALGSPQENNWILRVCQGMLQGNPTILSLFSHNPFPDKPPRFVRIIRYDYKFTDAAERAQNGHWWKRNVTDFYVSPLSLDQLSGR